MTSKYDRSDVDPMDAFEERPVDAADAPQDGEPWTDRNTGITYRRNPLSEQVRREQFVSHLAAIVGMSLKDVVDPAEHATHAIIDALGTLNVELAKVCTLDRIVSLRRMIQGLEQQVTELANTAATKHEEWTR